MLPTETSNQPQFAYLDENRHFSTDHLKGDLGGRSARGGAVTLGAQMVRFAIRMASTIALARLLLREVSPPYPGRWDCVCQIRGRDAIAFASGS